MAAAAATVTDSLLPSHCRYTTSLHNHANCHAPQPPLTPATTAAPQQQQWLFQPLPPSWWAVKGSLATTAAVGLIQPPISWAVRRQTTIVVAVGRGYSHHSRTLWGRPVMAQPLVKPRGVQPLNTTTVVAAEPTTATKAAPWWCRARGAPQSGIPLRCCDFEGVTDWYQSTRYSELGLLQNLDYNRFSKKFKSLSPLSDIRARILPAVLPPSLVLSQSPIFDSLDFFPSEEISPKDTETSVSPTSSLGSSLPIMLTISPLYYPFDKSIFAELDNSLWIIPRPLKEEPVPKEPNELDTYWNAHLWK
uniref:Uncharacterized protein n=1 Tax=Tanacetum cinerariifolium TaxID=118510 RepID=A0A6L2J6Q1_TANCI|nr:hypothetical protein [Tanacetum cinerariifolium]